MRTYSVEMLAATAMLACFPSSSGASGSKMVHVHTDHSHIGHKSDFFDSRLLRANNSLYEEERASLRSGGFSRMETIAGDALMHLRQKLHTVTDNTLTEQVCARIKQLDDRVVARYAGHLENRPEQLRVVLDKLSRDDLRAVKELIQTFEKDQANEPLKKTSELMSDLSSNDGVEAFEQTEEYLETLYPANLHILKNYVAAWNAAHKKDFSLLDFLVVLYGGVAKLAPALSIAKNGHFSGDDAELLQTEMVTKWLAHDTPVDEVFYLLELNTLGANDLPYEYLDTLDRYIALYKAKHPGADEDSAKCLRKHFDDGKVVRMIADAKKKSSYPNMVLRDLVKRWKFENSAISIVDIADKFREAVIDETTVLYLLLAFYGHVYDLARALSLAKKDTASRAKAEHLQLTMLTSWLQRKVSVKFVHKLLEPPNTRTAGLIFENMETLVQYSVLYNKLWPQARTSTLTYLRNQFDDGEIVRMIADAMKMSPYIKQILRGLVKRWKLENSAISIVDIADKFREAVIDETAVLNLLLAFYGHESDLARALSLAKKDTASRVKAEHLQLTMLTNWLQDKVLVEDVHKLLKPPNTRTAGIKFENMETLVQYMTLYNTNYPQARTSTLTYLRNHFDDGEIVRMIADAMEMSPYIEHILRDLVKLWKLENSAISIVDIADKFREAVIDETAVLNLLLAFYGHEYDLARAIYLAKKDTASRVKAEHLQHTMLTSWLQKLEPVQFVHNLLEPPDARTAGLKFENMETLVQYMTLYNTNYPQAHMDILIYLRHYFADGEIVRMIADAMEMSPDIKHILRDLVKLWKLENSAISIVDIADKFREAVIDETAVLNLLLAFYGHEYDLARALSLAKKDTASRVKAEHLQHTMLTSWLQKLEPVEFVYNLLKPPNTRTAGLKFKNMETLVQYMTLYNTNYPQAHMDILIYLRHYFADGEIVRMIADAMEMSPDIKHILRDLVKRWKFENSAISIVNIADKFRKAVIDETTVLDLLLAFYGHVYDLARALSLAKKDTASRVKAEHLQLTMLTSWLQHKVPVKVAYQLLEPPNTRTAGIKFENMETLVQYMTLYNTNYPQARTSILTYLRNQFDDGEIVRMIADAMEMSPDIKQILRDLVKRWKLENSAISIVDVADKFREAVIDETTVLNLLLAFYDHVSDLARALSLAKKDTASRAKAEHLQLTMLTNWLQHKLSVKAVHKLLKPPDARTAGLKFENMETLVQYMTLCNEVYPEKSMNVIKVLGVLFNNDEMVRMIVDALEMSPNIEQVLKDLVSRWKFRKKIPLRSWMSLINFVKQWSMNRR
ncbi:unnamed protein product [Hyaloperonospora brassicae]|uniref:RxLR effector candidate protein n=1 Tax=Hyaloperonospora brassicae TaxID=162125 RepID=A0AAV0U9K1_HYABA|nr:unnamed protein product [Hyaloperonospora brassicae]